MLIFILYKCNAGNIFKRTFHAAQNLSIRYLAAGCKFIVITQYTALGSGYPSAEAQSTYSEAPADRTLWVCGFIIITRFLVLYWTMDFINYIRGLTFGFHRRVIGNYEFGRSFSLFSIYHILYTFQGFRVKCIV